MKLNVKHQHLIYAEDVDILGLKVNVNRPHDKIIISRGS